MAIFLPPMYVLYGEVVFDMHSAQSPGPLYTALSFAIPAIIVVLFWVKIASTPGKLLIKSKIVDADSGGVPTNKQWALRYLGYYVAVLPLGIGIMCIHWDKRHQGWHDKMANTLVVKNSK